ncbi:MAG: hypothetical protein K2J30_04530, partial [Clostridia bacterium]|nr:hypothetical protein [Clostridia bacterium]
MSAAIAEEDYAAYGISTLSESAYTITATVEPDSATDKSLTCSMAFDFSQDSINLRYEQWANGKNPATYVSITQSADDALTFILSVKAAFGAPIEVTFTSVSNPDASASFTLNYIARLVDCDITIASSNGGANILAIGSATSCVLIPHYSDGTVYG